MSDLKEMLDGGKPTKNGEDPVVKIVALMFKARNDAHITHLKQPNKTLARHDAFGIFYDNIVDMVDTLYETYNGIHDTGSIVVSESGLIVDPIKYFKDAFDTIETLRKGVKESFVQNQIDSIQQEIAHTLFRLKNITT